MFYETMSYETITPLFAFGAGVLSVLSPCILPLLPVVLATSAGRGKLRPFAVVLGISTTFTLMGIFSSAFGAVFGAYIQYLKLAAGFLLVIMGLVMLFELNLFNAFSGLPLPVGLKEEGVGAGLVLGLSLGLLWIPCVGPILASILAMVALQGDAAYGAFMLFFYSLGFSVPMLLLAYSVHFSSTKLRLISQYDAAFRKGAGIVLLLAGVWMSYQNLFRGIFSGLF